MAQVMAEKLLAEAKIEAMVISAGTLGINGQPASAAAVRAMESWGGSLDGHRSQGISMQHLGAADHVVVMAPMHEQLLTKKHAQVADSIVRLWEYATPPGRLTEIADPVGLDDAAFLRCRTDLEECLRAWIATLPR